VALLEEEVTRVAEELYGEKWTNLNNALAWVRYPTASALRVLRQALRFHHAFKPLHQKVFEFGFGHGHVLFSFSPPAALYGVELSALAVSAAAERARRAGYSEYAFKRVRAEDSVVVEFPTNEFDIVICSHTLEHVVDDEKLLSELYRITRPEGRLFLLTPLDVHSTSEILARPRRRRPDFPEKSFHVWWYNLETLEDLVKRAGFNIVAAEALDAVGEWRLRWPRPVQIVTSLLLLVIPYGAWRRLDRLAVRLGYRPTQALVVARKLLR
jgi:SAM-dependent methyltransferase